MRHNLEWRHAKHGTSCVLRHRFDRSVACAGPHISNTLGQRGLLCTQWKCPVSSNNSIRPRYWGSSPENPLGLVAEERSFAPVGVTERQLECLAWVQEGKSASDIGGILGISSRTVEGHLLRLCEHFGVRTRVQAVLRARDLGLLKASAP